MGLFGNDISEEGLVQDTGLVTDSGEGEEQDPGTLMKVLDVLMRPNYASAGFAKKVVEGDPEDAMSAAWKGFVGKDKHTYRDVLTSAGWKDEDDLKLSDAAPSFFSETGDEWSKLKKGGFLDIGAKGSVGLLGDIFLDPSFYIGLGAYGKGAKGLKIAKKTIQPMARNLAKKTSIEMVKDIAPYVIHKNADDWITSLANTLVTKQGVIPEIAEELSKNIARRHTVTFFGKSVLPEFIDRPIVEATGKLLASMGESNTGRMMKELFVMGGANPMIRQSKIASIGMTSNSVQMMRMYNKQLGGMSKKLSKRQTKDLWKALYWLDDVSGGSPNYIDKAIAKYNLDAPVVTALNKIGEIQDVWIKAMTDAGIETGEITRQLSRWHPSKTMTEEGLEIYSRSVGKLASHDLKKMIKETGYKGNTRIFQILDESMYHEATSDWVFKVPKELSDAPAMKQTEAIERIHAELMNALNRDPAVFKALGKIPEIDYLTNTFKIPRFGIETGKALEVIDDFATETQAMFKPWTIDKANATMLKTFKNEAPEWLASDIKHVKQMGKEIQNLPDNFKFFYDKIDTVFPSRYLKAMENVRNKAFIDDLTTKFGYTPTEVFGKAMTRDFATKASRQYVEGSPVWEAARINQMFDSVVSAMEHRGITKSQVENIRKNMTKKIKEMGNRKAKELGIKTKFVPKVDDYIDGFKYLDETDLRLAEIIPDFEKAMEAKTVMKNSMAMYKPDIGELKRKIIASEIDGFNLQNFEQVERAVRTLEKQGKQVGVYVANDEWVKLYKEYGVKGKNYDALSDIFTKGEQGDGHYLLNMKKLKDFREEFSGITRDIKVNVVEKDALKEMHASYSKLSDYREVRKISKLYKDVYKLWKGHALLSPGYHVRNFVGNLSLNYLGGVTNPKHYIDARNIQKMATRFYAGNMSSKQMSKWNSKFVGSGMTMKKLWSEMAEEGIINRGFFAADLTRSMYDELANPKILNVFSSRHILLEKNRMIGEMIESNARIAHFIKKRAEGFSKTQSGQSVRKFLFDYADLTEVEKTYGKAVMPFYTFMRKNIPLQLEMMIKNPGKQALWGKLVNAAQGDLENRALLPQWMKEQGGIQIGTTSEGLPKYFPLQSYLPFADVTKLTGSGARNALLGQINPLFKAPIELMSPKGGYNTYFGKPIETFEGETEDFLGVQKIGKFFGGDIEKFMGKVKFRKKVTHVLRMVRGLNELDRLVGVRSKGLSTSERITRLITGMRLYPFDEAKESRYLKREFERETSRIKSIAKHLSPVEKKRALEKVAELTKDFQKTMKTAFAQKHRGK